MYKLSQYKNMVISMAEAKHIPFDPANTDYQAYLLWLADGNTPEAAESSPTAPDGATP